MKNTPKYCKADNGLVVEILHGKYNGALRGKVVEIGTSPYEIGEIHSFSDPTFQPYEPTPKELVNYPITANLTNDNPKDNTTQPSNVEIRLKCLELAIMGYNTDAIDKANEFFNWVTQTTK